MIRAVLKAFKKYVLPDYFGIHAISRAYLVKKTSLTATLLHNFKDSLGIICDGTYLRHEKSPYNAYKKKSFSGQKKTPLCKPFTMCTTNVVQALNVIFFWFQVI